MSFAKSGDHSQQSFIP